MAGAIALFGAAPAQANVFLQSTPLVAISLTTTVCAPGEAMAASPVPLLSKSAAILGGEMSALERIQAQQQQTVAAPLEPAPVAAPAHCLIQPVLAAAKPPMLPAPKAKESDFLATSRIAIKRTPFTREWQRVEAGALSTRTVESALGSERTGGMESLGAVNRWVNTNIDFASDRATYRKADYWATASQTLARGKGDCEDFAILKYQMLATLGVKGEDMFLTLARDLARNADHAVLVVRHEGRFYLLDNSTEAVLLADRSYDYRPTMSFSGGGAFLHGYTQAAPAQSFAYAANAPSVRR